MAVHEPGVGAAAPELRARAPAWVLAFGAGLALAAGGCATIRPTPGSFEEGYAVYYGVEFHGRTTASGEIYDMDALTAAHPTLPFGTRLEVKNLKNQKAVIVRVNDRSPGRKGRIVEVSMEAAKWLDMIEDGVVPARATVLSVPPRGMIGDRQGPY